MLLAGGFAAQHSRVPLGSDCARLLIVASLLLFVLPKTRPLAFLLAGFALFMQAGQDIVAERLAPEFAGDSILTQVRIVDFPRQSGQSIKLRVAPLDDQRLPPLSQLSWFEPPLLPELGDVWQLEVRLRRPRGASNPGAFDFEAWLFREKIQATGYVVDGKRNRLLEKGRGTYVDRIRQTFVGHAVAASDSERAAAVLAAVGAGARHLVSREQWHRYALSGTSHLMAISGLHVGLAAAAVFGLAATVLGILRLADNSYVGAVLIAAMAGSAYALISGLGVPARRASLMLIIVALATVRRRQLQPVRTLAAAAVLVYILDPVATMSPGFNLSFAAVVVLVWIAARKRRAVTPTNVLARVGVAIRELAGMQVILLCGLMPLTLTLFQRIALAAVPANLFAVPLFAFVTVPLSLAGLAMVEASEPTAMLLLRAAAMSIEWLESGIEQLVRLPFADIAVALPQGVAWPVILLPAMVVLLPPGWPGRYLAVVGILVLFCYAPRPPAWGCFDTHVLDVGQGLAVVVRTQRSTLLFDTGVAYRGGSSAGDHVIVPFLKSQRLRKIDWLMVSHADLDHSGGVGALTGYADVAAILVGEGGIAAGKSTRRCVEGQMWRTDGVDFTVLHPGAADEFSGNDASCVLLVSAGGHRLLLTGDIEARAERALLARSAIDAVNAVIVPHHGSLTSSSPGFVARLAPQLAVVSAAFGNRWGFPGPAIVERWQSVGATLLNTANDGAVSFRICRDNGLTRLRKDRHERRRFWRTVAG